MNHPTASQLERLSNCPASWHLTKDLPEETSEFAASGTRIHEALASGDMHKLNEDERTTAESCYQQSMDLKLAFFGAAYVIQCFNEFRLFLHAYGSVTRAEPGAIFSGQADLIAIENKHGLIIDYKTGRGEVEHAKDNAQLRGLAVLAAEHWNLDEVRVAIVQPLAGKPTVADYDRAALGRSTSWLIGTVGNCSLEGLAAKAGDWCQYCKARSFCKTFANAAIQPIENMAAGIASMEPKAGRAAMFARASALPADELAGRVKGLRLVNWYQDAITDVAKRRAADDPDFQVYYRLKDGIKREKVTDAQTVFSRLFSRHGVSASEFASKCLLTKTALRELLALKGLKGKELNDALADALAGCVEVTETAPQLEEVENAA